MGNTIVHFFWRNFDHVLAALLLLSRLGDLGTTYLVTPRLRLEANPLIRKLGWRFASIGVVFCVLPYFNEALAVMMLVPSLLVTAGNAGRIWFVRAVGEEEYYAILIRAARRTRLWQAVVPLCLSASFMVLTGVVVLLFYPDPINDWGFWLALGIVIYGLVIAFYGTLSMRRLFRTAATVPDAAV